MMDPAKELEQEMLARQMAINDAIAGGDSPVQRFYNGATVFVTGGSGFLGKQLIEKLLRSCEIKRLYMLLRSKKNQNIQERLDAILEDPLYDTLRKQQPHFANKIVPVEGDVEYLRLGLSNHDWIKLTQEVNIIFHLAASVEFNEPIKSATLINVRGTREALALGRQCKYLKCFNHISTAFAHATESSINSDVEERFYPTPVSPDVMIEMVETIDEARMDAITPELIDDWPNTYTFTKALAEELIRTNAGAMPVCIVRPSFVVSTYIEPSPGWVDLKTCLSSPLGVMAAIGLGLVHVTYLKRDTVVSYAPVDYVNNAIITACWDTVQTKKHGSTKVPIYTVSSSQLNTRWGYMTDVLKKDGVAYISPKAAWYCFDIETSNKFIYWLLTWLLHYIPGYMVDSILDWFKIRPKGIPSLINIYSRIYKMSLSYQFFSFNSWIFKEDNLRGMVERMSGQDRAIFNCDVRTMDIRKQLLVIGIGFRKYILKDGLEGTIEANKRQKYIFKYINIIFFAVYGFVIYFLLYLIYSLFATIISLLLY